ncbi:ABC transporter C family member 8-like [Senna tora]|uniref:ABC-type xenobiotic transporter n=1 Tax=Senna tora TaxID=362788 RepID=A0A835CIE6_9FABA|nr:ABC transporter C family member 8-like [Senna tora]
MNLEPSCGGLVAGLLEIPGLGLDSERGRGFLLVFFCAIIHGPKASSPTSTLLSPIACLWMVGVSQYGFRLHRSSVDHLQLQSFLHPSSFSCCCALIGLSLQLRAHYPFRQIASSEHSQSNTMFEPLLHHEKVKNSQTTLSQANFFSRFTFSWINPVLSLGHSKALSLENIPPLESQDKADTSYQKFAKAWDSLLPKGSSNKNLVIRAILKVFLKENISTVISAFARSTSAALSPLLIYAFVKYNNSERNLYEGLGLFGLLFLSRMVESLCQRHWFFSSRRSGMRMRSALMVAAYEKLLNLSSLGRSRHSSGEIVNCIAVDAYRMGESLWWFHSGWSFALQLVLAIVVLFCVVGLGALPGLVLLLISALLNVPFAMKLKKCQSEVLVSQDQRLRATSEILNNIKIIKLQSWEDKFKGSVESLRDEEFKWVSETQFTKAYGSVLYFISPTIICAVIFLGCALFESATLNAATIFTVFATMRSMGEPVRFIPEALSVMVQTKISLDRLNAFLLEDETKSDDEKTRKSSLPYSDNSVEIKAADFRWDQESLTPSLRCINLAIKRGQKIAVCGPVGAGKSSVLHAILGEMPNTSGTVKVHGTIAYVSQTSWIQSGTIRDNILFGKSLEEAQYENAIKACALDKDISGFKHGDLTEIGQRGINLSGGQKQRIQLARAVYDDADIYLLDDPFSAVDAHTSSVLFHECVMTALREKTVILVTHQVEFLSEVDNIMVIEGGCIAEAGSYEELMASGTTFEQLIAAHKDAMTGLSDLHQNQEELREVDIINTQERHYEGEVGEAIQLTQEEQREMGSAVWKMFLDYVVISKGLLLLCLSLISLVGVAVFLAASSYWLAIATQSPKITKVMMVGVYTGLSIPSAVFVYLRSLFVAHLGLKASKAFFSGFNSAIFNAPMSFFDSTPVGRIITRASSDLSTLDFDIPFATVNAPHTAVELLVGIVIMAYATWEVLIVAAAAAVAAIYIMGYYQVSARELVRINGITKAPVVSCTAETLAGVVTIRAFKMVDRFFLSFLHLVDIDATLFLHTNAAMEWLLLRMEMLQNLILFTEALLILFLPKGYVTSGLVGFSMSYALSSTRTQIFFTQWACKLSNYIISAERIKQFMLIPQEPPKVVEDKRPSPSWPSKGRIELQDLKVKYRPNSPPVLKGITCTFREGARIGIVGRTGSGKSTLISSLFRLVEPASGKILIDEINICSIGLKDLRMRLSIIPQEPTLFRGSVRTNLDPLGQFSDDEIWKTLEKCQLKEAISSLPNLLDSSVNDEGDNWSVGQRQLFCLGRVLLRRNRILVLDEATASIDSATDAILQRVIREEFSECTIITVAHRVPTVLDSDMVMVLSYGKIVEYDEPSKLLEANSSSFSKLVAEYWSSSRKNP